MKHFLFLIASIFFGLFSFTGCTLFKEARELKRLERGDISIKVSWGNDDRLRFKRSETRERVSVIRIVRKEEPLWGVNNQGNDFLSMIYTEVPTDRNTPRIPRQGWPEDNKEPPELREGDEIFLYLTFRHDSLLALAPTQSTEVWRIIVPAKGEKALGTFVEIRGL